MESDARARRERAAARRGRITLRRARLDDDTDPDPVRGEAALSLVTRLTRTAWQLSGRPFPEYVRAETLYRFVRGRPGDRAPG